MTDDRAPAEKPIKLPEVELIAGFQIHCHHINCGRIGFHKKRVKAEELKAAHSRSHEEHEKSVREHLKALQSDQDEAAANGIQLIPQLHCPTCLAAIGDYHVEVCDVARCLTTGAQRRLKDHIAPDDKDHDCGADVWTGYFPGEHEASKYGVPLAVLKEHGTWSPERLSWVLADDWAEKAGAPGRAQ